MQIGDPVLYLALINQQVASGWSKHSFECGKMTSDFEVLTRFPSAAISELLSAVYARSWRRGNGPVLSSAALTWYLKPTGR